MAKPPVLELAPRAVSPKTAGDLIDQGLTKTNKLIRSGELVSYVEGGSRRVLVASIDEYIARRVIASKGKSSLRPGGPGRRGKP
jgi:hypothetical protein